MQPRRERSGADVTVVVVDFEDVGTGKMEAGSGIKSTFLRTIFSSTRVSLGCESEDRSSWWYSDSGGIGRVDAADGTREVDGKELEERHDIRSGVDADASATAARDISSPRGNWETGGRDTVLFGVGGACDSGMEIGLGSTE